MMIDGGSHLEVLWEEPRVVRICERLERFARVVLFDPHGTGLSDPAGDTLTLEQQTDDLLAVLDAVGFERPAFVGATASGRLAVFAAATHPARFSALVLFGSSVTGSRYWAPERLAQLEALIIEGWGTGRYGALYVPSIAEVHADGYALLGIEALYAANVSRTEQSADGAQEFLDAVLGSRRTWLPTPGMGEAFSLSDRRVEGCGLAAERELIVLSAFPATD